MKIRSMTATFGCLDNVTLQLSGGVETICLPNESGKSTWAAFLLAMFYGVDTGQRASKDFLPEKIRYQPWNGKAMAGTVELEHLGRKIVLQRTSQRGKPMGVFHAYDRDTGLELPEITGENCGLYFLGVEKSVFQRSAFLSGGELIVTENKDLAKRLENLAVSGTVYDSYPTAANRLRQWKNRHRYHQNGLIPEAETALEEAAYRMEDAADRRQAATAAKAEYEACLAEAEAMEQTERAAWQQHRDAASRNLYDVLARKELADHNVQSHRLALPEETLEQLRDSLRRLEQEPLPPEPDCPPALRGIDADAILSKVQRDQSEYAKLTAVETQNAGIRLWLALIPALLAVAAAIGQIWWAAAVCLAAAVMGLWFWQRAKRSNRRVDEARRAADALLASYGVRKQEDLLPAAMERRDWLLNRERVHRLSWETDVLLEKLREIDPTMVPDAVTADLVEQNLAARREQQEAAAALEVAEAEHRSASAPWYPSPALMKKRETTARLQSQAENRQAEETAHGSLETAVYRHAQLQEKLDRLRMQEKAIALAQEALDAAHSQLEQVYAPQLTGLAGEYLQTLTTGRYDALILGKDWHLQARERATGLTRPLAALSSGTQDQIWLALRLAMAKLLLPPDTPLVLDDALLTFDETRTAAAMEILRQEQRQVILFACKDGPGEGSVRA